MIILLVTASLLALLAFSGLAILLFTLIGDLIALLPFIMIGAVALAIVMKIRRQSRFCFVQPKKHFLISQSGKDADFDL